MAIWQYDFALIPEQGILRIHNHFPDQLEEYTSVDFDAELDLEKEFPNYWMNVSPSCNLNEEFLKILPSLKSWSDDALMYGTEDGNKIEYWNDGDINCRIDMRKFNVKILTSILALAKKVNCKIVPKDHGRILEPEVDIVLRDIKKSRALKFVIDPRGFLEDLSNIKSSKQQNALDKK